MKKELLIAASAVAVAGVASNANAIDVELYGQVNKGVMIVDDGQDTEFNVVDNDFSSTRFGLKGEQALDNGLTASALLEMEYQTNASDVLTQNQTIANAQNTPNGVVGNLAARHSRVGLGGDFGAIFVGHTSTATDGVTEQDMAGAGDVLGSDIEDLGGAMFFRTAGGGYSTDSVGTATDNMDGNGRQDLVRYDSPIFNGFQVRVSAAQGGDMDTGVFYHGRIDEFAIKGGLGYVAFNTAATGTVGAESQISGSLSAKHDSGFGATVAYGQQELENGVAGTNDDPTFYYVKLGYTWDAFEVAADYSKHENGAGVADDETTYYGLAGQYNLGHGVSAAAYYKNFEFDDSTATSFEDMSVYGVNMRVKF